jgi:hypothetical protein
MKILIIGDEDFRIRIRIAIKILLGMRGEECDITQASSVDQAMPLLERADGVVCQQSVPTHSSVPAEPPEIRSANWAGIGLTCSRAKKPFVLVSASRHLVGVLNRVKDQDFASTCPIFALAEPVEPDVVAETIVAAVAGSREERNGEL